MSVVGFDIGNENCVVAIAKQRAIDVVLNDESNRETPALVAFSEKQRFIGTAASASLTMNPKNTIAQIKRLVGRLYRDPEVQQDLNMLPFTVTEGPDGSPFLHVQYLGETRSFTPTEILGMVLSNVKGIAENNLQTHVTDCVIGIPVFFNEIQRRAVLDAAAIAGLHPLRLMHETTATALAYGIYKTDLPENDPINVVFVDVGHASMQVCVVAFKKGQLKVLAHAFDRSLGGRDFDDVVFHYFCGKFREEYKIDVQSNARASQRLRAACEKLKKMLSANPEAPPLNIECLMDEKDVKGRMKRDEFERLSQPLLERTMHLCERALSESAISTDKLYAVEVVGSGSRVPAILKIISAVLKKEPSRTMNASECVARGCALQCAMLSPTFRVREFEVQDAFPFSIALAWRGSAPELEEEGAPTEIVSSSIVFPKGNPFPSTKMLTFFRSGTFTMDVLYADMHDLPPGTPQKIKAFTIGPFQPSKSEKAKIKVKVRLNLHGIVELESATMIEEEEVEVPVKSNDPSLVMDIDKESTADVMGASASASDVKVEAEGTGAAAGGDENGPSAPEPHPSEMDVESSKKDTAKKKKIKRTDISVNECLVGGISQSDLQKSIEKEFEMALQDRVMEETKDKKNAVEAYVYDMRNKMYERYRVYATDAEKEELSRKLQETEDWLYEDGEDESKGVYIAKLAELKKLGDPIEDRFKEDEGRGPAMEQLLYRINSFREAARSKDPKFDHIDASEKEKVIGECDEAEDWFKEKSQLQGHLPKSANPGLLCAEIKKKVETLDRFCKPIMMKPRPPPPKPSAPVKPTGQGFEKSPAEGPPAGGGTESSEPMDTENPQQGEAVQLD